MRKELPFILILWIPITILGADVSVTVVPAVTELRCHDPLFVKVVVQNKSKEVIGFDRHIATVEGTIWFEVQSPGEAKFSFAPSRYHGGFVPLTVEKGSKRLGEKALSLKPDEKYVSYEAVFGRGAQYAVFSQPGKYQIRARIVQNGGIEGVSEPIVVEVSDAPPAEVSAIRDFGKLLRSSVGPSGIPSDTTGGDLDELSRQLSDGLLKQTLDWMILVLKIRDVEKAEDFQPTRKQLSEMLKNSDAVTRDVVALLLADEWVDKKEYKLALKELEAIHERNFLSYDIRLRIENRIWEDEHYRQQKEPRQDVPRKM